MRRPWGCTSEWIAEKAGIQGFFDRQGKDDPRAIQAYLCNVAVENGFGDYFEIGGKFGAVMRPLTRAQMWLQDFVRNMTVDDDPCPTFQLSHFVESQRLEALLKCISGYSLAHDIVKLIEKNSDLKFGLFPTGMSVDNAFRLADDMSAGLWQAFGVVLGEVRNRDELFRREERKHVVPRELRLGMQVTDDRIAEAIRNAQECLRDPRGTPAVVVSQLMFALEACIRRVCRKELSYPNASVVNAIDQCTRATDSRMRRFGTIAYALYKNYRNEATHNSDELEVSRAEAAMFVTGVQVLHELTKVLGK